MKCERLEKIFNVDAGQLIKMQEAGRWYLSFYDDIEITVLELYDFVKSIFEMDNEEIKEISVDVLGTFVVIDQKTTVEEFLITLVGNVHYDSYVEFSRAVE